MKKKRSPSISKQARYIADKKFGWFMYYKENPEEWTEAYDYNRKTGEILYLTVEQYYLKSIQKYCCNHLIKERAAARFGRKVREYYKKRGIN